MPITRLFSISAALFLAALMTGSASADDFRIRVGVSSGDRCYPSSRRVYYRSAPRTYRTTRVYHRAPRVTRVYYSTPTVVYRSAPVTRVYRSSPVVVYEEPRRKYVRYETRRSCSPSYRTYHKSHHYRRGYSSSCRREYVRPRYDHGRRASLRFYYDD